MPDMNKFRAKDFLLDHFGDAGNIISICRKYRVVLPTEGVLQWLRRNRVPGEWLVQVIGVLERETGKAVTLLPYIGRNGRKER